MVYYTHAMPSAVFPKGRYFAIMFISAQFLFHLSTESGVFFEEKEGRLYEIKCN